MKQPKKTPVTVTRGSNPQVNVLIDWISGTFKGENRANMSYPPEFDQKRVQTRPLNGYDIAVRYGDGRLEMQNSKRIDMGIHFTWSGEVLRNLPISAPEALEYMISSGATITRIDIAIDVFNMGLDPRRATAEIEAGNIKTRAKQKPFWGSPGEKGYTQYVGKKSSEIFLRIYNKAAEMGIEADYTRVELSVKDERAHKAAIAILRGDSYRSLVLGFCTFPLWDEWLEVMGMDAISLPAERTTSKTKEWILRSVVPAIARELELDGDDDFWFQFIEQVRIKRAELADMWSV